MTKYECMLCGHELVELTVQGWHYCSDCDIEYSKIILTPIQDAKEKEAE